MNYLNSIFKRNNIFLFFLISIFLLLTNNTHAAENKSAYSINVSIPAYDSNNSEHFLITSSSDWSHINDSDKRYFYVEPGLDYGTVTITADGSESEKRFISLYNGNDTHPAKLDVVEQANVKLIFSDAHYWIVDRMSGIDNSTVDEVCFIAKSHSSHIVFNRLYLTNFYDGILIQGTLDSPFTTNITVQNSRLDPMSAKGLDDDRVAIILTGENWNISRTLMNTKILNNEIRNCNDGIQPVARPQDGLLVDYPGTIIDCNHIYADSDVYTDGSGNQDPTGLYAWTENAIDLKGGSSDTSNPMIISNNYFWGYKWTDPNGGGSGDAGTAAGGHYHVKNVIFENNVIFDSNRALSFADPGGLPYSAENASITGNIMYNIGHSPTGGVEYAHYFYSSKNLSFTENTIVGVNKQSRWLAHNNDETDMTVSCNVIIDSYEMTGIRSSTTSVLNNTFYNTILQNTGDGTSYPNASDANMADLIFTTDNYTNNPKTITIPGVVTTDSSPHAGGCFASVPGQATNPNPLNGSANNSTLPVLSWTASSNASSHNVYFGTNSPPSFIQNQVGPSYMVEDTLEVNTTYYWRIDEENDEGITTGAEWSFKTSEHGVINNLALNKSVSFSSEQETGLASYLVDGIVDDEVLRWSATPYPQWVEVDLGQNYLLSKTELVCHLGRDYQFIVEKKTDIDSPYSLIVDRSDNTQSGTADLPIVDTFSEVAGRYVRITVTGAGAYSGDWISLLEFRVFGIEGGPTLGIYPETEMLAPTDLSLNNYPNPFRHSTNIEFNLPEDGYISIKIFNLMGSEIADLANSHYAAGSHSIEWNVNNSYFNDASLGAQVFLLKIQFEDQFKTRKIVLEK